MRSVALLGCAALFVRLSLCTPRAAIYVDNGRDQTAIDRLMTRAEKEEMELEILNLLGLPNRPRRINGSPLKRSAPRFLLDVYRSLAEEDEAAAGRGERHHHVSGVRHERGKRLWFNVTEVPVAEDIVGAELRMYKNEEKPSKDPDAKYTVTVYQLVNTDDGERELEYVSALNTTAGFSGWLGLNLTACLATWVAFPDSNKGLYLSVHPVSKPGHEIRPEELGLVTVKAEDEKQPFMVAFLKAVNHVKARTTRDIKPRIRKSTSTLSNVVNGYKNNEPDARRSCRIQTLYISFKDLKWQDWIIAPDGYAAYYCAGECNFPLNAHMNATNHAIVQTLVHLMNPWRYPKPCCAPTKLNPISVLYFLDDQNVILKKYKKMVVKSCGCH
ncbi:hypothetical protein NQ318_019780 [Aromia moschata]|uniref:TGF-beta family profile domain-containing protein n=1 Tax=Aromia moschata TaxID=1265417 RepID=A0AAV8YJX9_9CUCU|nr:hypothetical protein NQ318_019780 [Aromia moschata]